MKHFTQRKTRVESRRRVTLRERLFVLMVFVLVLLTGCSEPKLYYIRFDHVDRLKIGDFVYVDSVYAGKVDHLQTTGDHQVLVTINIEPGYALTKGSTFTMNSEFLVLRRIDIEPGKSKELIDPEEIQMGFTAPGLGVISKSTYDSLMKNDQRYRLMDTLGKLVDAAKKPYEKEDGN